MGSFQSLISGKKTYISLAAGVIVAWGIVVLGATCPTDPAAVADAAADVCKEFAGIKVTVSEAAKLTWAAITGGALRAGIAKS